MLDKVLKRSDAVDKESLCVLANQRVGLFIRYNARLTLFRYGTSALLYIVCPTPGICSIAHVLLESLPSSISADQTLK
jgi:hypothetical protein